MNARFERLLLIGVLVAAGCDDDGPEHADDGAEAGDRTTAILSLTGDVSHGRVVYEAALCASSACHGDDGRSGAAPSLAEQVPLRTDEEVLEVLLNGKGSMPPQDSLSDQDLADVFAWLRETFS